MDKRIDAFDAQIRALEQQSRRKFSPKEIAIYWEIWLGLLSDARENS